jgi:hypothetical protein
MSTHSLPSLAEVDLTAANRIAAEADQIAAEVRTIDNIVQSLIKGHAWTGRDAIGFGMRWERELGELVTTSANLRACANDLRRDALWRWDAATELGNPYPTRADVVA